MLWTESCQYLDVVFCLNTQVLTQRFTQRERENKVHCYAVVSHSSDRLDFHFYYYFPRTPESIWDTLAKLMFRFKAVLIPKNKKKSMTFCSALTEVWQTAFIPNNSCMEEVTPLEKQMIGERHREGEDMNTGQTAGRKQLIESIKI